MEEQPDVVVSDIMMPQSDGLDLIGVLRALTLPDESEETLTVTETRLLLALLDHVRQGLSCAVIFERMGRQYSPLDRTVDVLVGRLRRKLGDEEKNPKLIVVTRSAGHMPDMLSRTGVSRIAVRRDKHKPRQALRCPGGARGWVQEVCAGSGTGLISYSLRCGGAWRQTQ